MLEGLEARRPRLGQCRWRPEGYRYPKKTLKERLCYVPEEALAITFVLAAMDTTAAGKVI